jgi:hypothetical protein
MKVPYLYIAFGLNKCCVALELERIKDVLQAGRTATNITQLQHGHKLDQRRLIK